MIILLSIIHCKVLEGSSPQKRKLAKNVVGVGSYMLGYITGDHSYWSTANDYCEAVKILHNKDKSKELEVLLMFQKTFMRDLENKCKIVFRKLNEDEITDTYKKMARICKLFAKFSYKHLAMSDKFYLP